MKKNLRLLLMFAAFGIVLASSTAVFSQRTVGGFKDVAVDDKDVVAAADYAVAKKSEEQEVTISLESIEKAESQIVAGTNYRLTLKVTSSNADGEKTEAVSVKVIVFRNLQGEYSLTSWSSEE